MPYSVKIDHKGLLRRQHRAFEQANRELSERFELAVTSPIWDWPRATVRKDGSVAGSPRDIVDSRELLESYERRQEGVGRFVHAWTAPHALITIRGWVGRSGAVVPPRDFTEQPIRELPELFAKAYRDAT